MSIPISIISTASYPAAFAHGVTSLVDLGLPVMMADVDIRLREAFESIFGETVSDG
jgi:lipoate-protein ligase B